MAKVTEGTCPLCKRETHLVFHHFIPRKMHRRPHFKKNYSKEALLEGVMLCAGCHKGMYKFYDEMTLAKQFTSLEAMQNDPNLAQHFAWVAKQKVQR